MTNQTLTNLVSEKANELNVHPKILLFSLAVVRETKNRADITDEKLEANILLHCTPSIAEDMGDTAKRQTHSKRESVREAGYTALSSVSEFDVDGKSNQIKAILEILWNREEIRKYHLVATEYTIRQLNALKNRHPGRSIRTIINSQCIDELQKLDEFAHIMALDFNFN